MTKASQAFSVFFSLVGLYVLLLNGTIPVSTKIHDEILPLLPFWALVAFGSYALGTLGWDVITFNDKPEKHKELLQVSMPLPAGLRPDLFHLSDDISSHWR